MFFGHHTSAAVRHAMERVPRAAFLPPAQQAQAGADQALPIACGQTASQPSLVGLMTTELRLTRQSRVLEIGTGSGYQTAILAELAAEVFTIERIAALAATARERLAALGYRNVHFHVGDGGAAWPQPKEFDAIIVTAAAPDIPAALVHQLARGGRMVIPVDRAAGEQDLILGQRSTGGEFTTQKLGEVRFVPMLKGVR